MRPKMIGLVISSMDSETTLSLYAGIKEKALEYNLSTQGYVIYPSQISSEAYNEGEFFMFETIDYRMYDGLIIALDTISSDSTKQLIIDNIRGAQIPIIAIDCDFEGAYKINTANYESVKKMVSHLIDIHGRTKINYISGPETNAESNLRLTAYKHALEDRGLSYENRIFEGTFYVNDGEEALDYFEKSEKASDFDAIVCGNDMQAIAVMAELEKRGYKVPEDVSVTGFDDIMDCVDVSPTITTITKDNYKVGTTAIELLNRLFAEEKLPKVTNLESKLVIRASCGCKGDVAISNGLRKANLRNYRNQKLFQAYNKIFVEKGTECSTFREYLEVIKEFIANINPTSFSLHIHKNFAEMFDVDDCPSVEILCPDGKNSTMYNVLLYSFGHFIPLEMIGKFNDKEMDPDKAKEMFENMPALQYLNSPLHYLDIKIGFVAFGNSDFPTMPSLYFNWISSMNNTINIIYNKMLLTELYRTDSLTGIYNRFGLEYYWNKYVADSQKSESWVNIVFADMNGLKYINDNFGHEEGDFVIKTVCQAMNHIKRRDLKCFRYGGDEFVILGVGYTDEQLADIYQKYKDILNEILAENPKDYEISLSLGSFKRTFDSTLSMEESIKAADKEMYIEKEKYHNK